MAQYRKKPVVIEAVRWTAGNADEVLGFIYADDRWKQGVDDGVNVGGPGIGHSITLGTLDIPTLEGVMTAQPGDWIIRGVKGEVYPCKPDIFEATYEAADDGYMSPDERLREFGTLGAGATVTERRSAEMVERLIHAPLGSTADPMPFPPFVDGGHSDG